MAEVFHFVKKLDCTGLPREFHRCAVSTGYLLVWILAGGNERSPTYKCNKSSTKLRDVMLALQNQVTSCRNDFALFNVISAQESQDRRRRSWTKYFGHSIIWASLYVLRSHKRWLLILITMSFFFAPCTTWHRLTKTTHVAVFYRCSEVALFGAVHRADIDFRLQ